MKSIITALTGALACTALFVPATPANAARSTPVAASAGSAKTNTVGPLNPEPPDSYTCSPRRHRTVCVSDTSEVVAPTPIGIVCGTGDGKFDVIDLEATRRVKAMRVYDDHGDLVTRVRENIFYGTRLGNPVTGVSVPYRQHDIDTDILATRGDLSTATTYSVESLVATAPGYGVVLVNKGRSVYGPDGSVLSRTGRRDLDDYFAGNTAAVAKLCAALGG
jgi:hypothetical protein